MSLFVRNCVFNRNLYIIMRAGIRRYCKTNEQNEPVKFSTSDAAAWRAEFTRKGAYDDSPEIQPYIVSLSTAIFLYYFFWLREESDIDENLNLLGSIYEKVDGLEEVQLKIVREQKLIAGEDVSEIDERLRQLENIRILRESAKNTLDQTIKS